MAHKFVWKGLLVLRVLLLDKNNLLELFGGDITGEEDNPSFTFGS